MKWKSIKRVTDYSVTVKRDGVRYRLSLHNDQDGWRWCVSNKMFPLALPALGKLSHCPTPIRAKSAAEKWLNRYVVIIKPSHLLSLNGRREAKNASAPMWMEKGPRLNMTV